MELEKPEQVMMATHMYYGILARRHAKAWFWADQTDRAMEKALKKLKDGEFINWPSDEERANYNIPEPFIWLDWRGILFVAAQYGLKIEEPEKVTETWKRDLKKQLAQAGIYWMRNPGWSTVRHDILCMDMSIRLYQDINTLSFLEVKTHLADHAFRVGPDKVRFPFASGSTKMEEKEIIPDVYFTVCNHKRQQRGEPYILRLPIEVDNGTHPEATAIARKLAAGAYWLHTEGFKKRFGDNTGIWMIITLGDKRLENMMEQVRAQNVAWAHLFTTTEEIDSSENVFLDPIWRQANNPDTLVPFPL